MASPKRLVEMMGSDPGVTGQPERGVLFRVTCQIQPQQPEDAGIEAHPPATAGPLTILLAEDDPISRMLVKIGLEQRGHRVVAVENGLDACEAAGRQRFDVILMDLQMPVMDGAEAARHLRSREPPLSAVPIVVLSADPLSAGALTAGAVVTDVLAKPVEWDAVEAVLSRLSARHPTASASGGNPASDDHRIPLLDQPRLQSLTAMMARSDFDELIDEIAKCAESELLVLKGALDRTDLASTNDTAHNIRGMFLNIGGLRVASLAHRLQLSTDIAIAQTLIPRIRSAVEGTMAELRRFCDTG